MRRFLEFTTYGAIILVFLIRYANTDTVEARRPAIRQPVAEAPALLPGSAQLPTDIAPRVEVQLEAKARNGVGTAFAVTHNGVYVTARHVVDGCADIFISKTKGVYVPVERVQIDTKRDYAILQSVRFLAAPVLLANMPPRRGDDGYMMGYPQGNPADVRATVIGNSEMRSSGRYRAREPVVAWVERERRPFFGGALGGISGGPVFDKGGVVVGTVVAGSPRRGRVYTTHPRVFSNRDFNGQARFKRTSAEIERSVGQQNYDAIGKQLRAGGTIAQVYCRVTKP